MFKEIVKKWFSVKHEWEIGDGAHRRGLPLGNMQLLCPICLRESLSLDVN